MVLLEGLERRWLERNLEANDIPFVVIGGVAVKFYCPERERNDVDVFVGADPVLINRLIAVIPDLAQDPAARIRLLSDKRGNAEVRWDRYKIDVKSFATGLDFAEACRTATEHEEQGVSLPIVKLELLLQHKQAVCQAYDATEQDHHDVELLQRARHRL